MSGRDATKLSAGTDAARKRTMPVHRRRPQTSSAWWIPEPCRYCAAIVSPSVAGRVAPCDPTTTTSRRQSGKLPNRGREIPDPPVAVMWCYSRASPRGARRGPAAPPLRTAAPGRWNDCSRRQPPSRAVRMTRSCGPRALRLHRAEGAGRGRRVGSVALVQLDVAAPGIRAAEIAGGLITALEPDPEEIIATGLAVVGHPDAEVAAVTGVRAVRPADVASPVVHEHVSRDAGRLDVQAAAMVEVIQVAPEGAVLHPPAHTE